MKYKKLLYGFLVLYFLLLVLTPPTSVVSDEGAQAMDSLFYFNFYKDFVENPSLIFNLKEYAFNLYAQYPALYLNFHPSFYTPITGLLFFITGVNFFATKFLSMIFSVGSLYVIFKLGKDMYGEKVGFYSAIATAFAVYYFFFSKLAMLEIPLLFFAVLSVYFFYKVLEEGKEKYYYYLGVSLGLGFLAKYLIIFMAFALFLYFAWKRKLKKNYVEVLKTAATFFLVSLPVWIIIIFLRGWEVILFWLRSGASQGSFIFHLIYFPRALFFEIFPFIFLLPLVYFLWKRKASEEDKLLIYLILFYLIGFTLTTIKTEKYILPAIPLIPILFARTCFEFKKYSKYLLAFGLIGEILMCIFIPAPFISSEKLRIDRAAAAEYINQRIDENANVFVLGGVPKTNGFVFHFARMNDFENGIIRRRRCFHRNMTGEEILNQFEKYNVQYAIGEPKRNFKEVVEENFEKVAVRGKINIYRRVVGDFEPPNRVCNYNCKLKREFCTKI